MPVAGYAFNNYAPWRSETIKALFQVVLTALVGYAYTVVATDLSVSNGDDLVEAIKGAFAAVVSALYAHNLLWKPANINIKFGARPTPTQLMDSAEKRAWIPLRQRYELSP